MAAPKRQLSLFDAVCLIVGVIIGAGIFRTTPAVAAQLSQPQWVLGIWLIGGLLSLAGAICYAELTSSMPADGGEYVYLTRAYGRRMGFLFAWCEFWIIRPGSIGAMAYVFAAYGAEFLQADWREFAQPVLAAVAIGLLTLTNLCGVRTGKWTQNLLTMAKVVGLLAVIVAGLLLAGAALPAESPAAQNAAAGEEAGGVLPATGNLSFALILVLFTYGGWNDIALVAAEVRHPGRNMFRALVLGVSGVAAIYLLLNVSLLGGLGHAGLAASASAPTQLLVEAVGPAGGLLVAGLICLATLGAINAMIFTGSRIYYVLGREHRLYAFLGRWSDRFDAPIRSLLLQAGVALALVLSFGHDENQFERLVVFTTPLFWLFILLVAISTVVLRFRLPSLERPYRMPLYPAPAIILGATAVFMVYSSLRYSLEQAHVEGFWTLGLLAAGLLASRWDPPPASDASNGSR